jgi:hypothetical protein
MCVPLLRVWVCSVSISPEYGCPVTGDIMRNIPGAMVMLLVVATPAPTGAVPEEDTTPFN